MRDETISRLGAEPARTAEARREGRSAKVTDAHNRAECAPRDHPTLSRYLHQTKTGLQPTPPRKPRPCGQALPGQQPPQSQALR